ncbi:MAG TPA: glycosyltransferase [Nitrososphaeraceae archaeon]|nr:glycosyltransferase [Nitrososphaeraceae archaeon]
MIIQKESSTTQEMNKNRWIIRYFMLSLIGIILLIKIYFMLFIVDFTIGFYSFLTSLTLCSIFLFSYLKFKDPLVNIKKKFNDTEPLISIIIPVKNEEDNIENCIKSCIDSSYKNKEIIVVNDGSTDKTPRILERLMKENPNALRVLHLPINLGKKHAIEKAIEIANGKFYVFMDSDCNMFDDAVENLVKIFLSDNEIGAITGHGNVRNADTGNLLEKIQDVWFDGQYRIIKGMEGSFSSLTCCSGSLSAFRREAIINHIHEWANDRFLGMEFKFATDRRLTAFILAEKIKLSSEKLIKNKQIKENGRKIKSQQWKLKYSPSVKVEIGVPKTLRSLIKQQIRWRKSFIRSIFATGSIYWQRPLPVAIIYYLTIALRLFRPYIIIKSLIILPLTGDILSGIFYLGGAMFSGLMYGIDVRLRKPGYPRWFYRPLMNVISTFIFTWLIIYAAITIKNKTWR